MAVLSLSFKPPRASRAGKCRKQVPPTTPTVDHRAILARRFDVEAGIELAHGHHLAAERLAWRAAELRERAQ